MSDVFINRQSYRTPYNATTLENGLPLPFVEWYFLELLAVSEVRVFAPRGGQINTPRAARFTQIPTHEQLKHCLGAGCHVKYDKYCFFSTLKELFFLDSDDTDIDIFSKV